MGRLCPARAKAAPRCQSLRPCQEASGRPGACGCASERGKASSNPTGGNSTILSSSRQPRSGRSGWAPAARIRSAGSGLRGSARCSASMRRLATGGSPGHKLQPRFTATRVCKSDGEGTFTGTYGNGKIAPKPAVGCIERQSGVLNREYGTGASSR
jgi:hypothetical protein